MATNNKWIAVVPLFLAIQGLSGCSDSDTASDSNGIAGGGNTVDSLNINDDSEYLQGLSESSLPGQLRQFETEADVKTFLSQTISDWQQGEREGAIPSSPSNVVFSGGEEAAADTGNDVSGTNLIVEGVDEGDIVKTDGNLLYVGSRQSGYSIATSFAPQEPGQKTDAKIRIMALSEAPPAAEEVGMLSLSQPDANLSGLYLQTESADQKILVALSQHYGAAGTTVHVDAFNVADPQTEQTLWTLQLDGSLISDRRVGNQLILVLDSAQNYPVFEILPVSDELAESDAGEAADTSSPVGPSPLSTDFNLGDITPTWQRDSNPSEPLFQLTDCLFADDLNHQPSYYLPLTTVVTIDLSNPVPQATCAAIPYPQLHMTTENIYLLNTTNIWSGWAESLVDTVEPLPVDSFIAPGGYSKPITQVHKFKFDAGRVEYQGTASTIGSVGYGSQGAFRIGEVQGYLGVFTSYFDAVDGNTHRLTMFGGTNNFMAQAHLPNDNRPQAIGKPGEDLYGARFVGNRAYAVTYRNVDPLYAIDLADPLDPLIAGELEIPGYSDYLHPLGENLLLGVGKDAIPDTGGSLSNVFSFSFYQGVKLGLFDISDISAPQEINSILIGKRGTSSPALYDHHAFTTLQREGDSSVRIALPISLHEREIEGVDYTEPSAYYGWSADGLYQFEVDLENLDLAQVGRLVIAEADDRGAQDTYLFYQGLPESRSVLVNDAVHFINYQQVWSSSWGIITGVLPPQ